MVYMCSTFVVVRTCAPSAASVTGRCSLIARCKFQLRPTTLCSWQEFGNNRVQVLTPRFDLYGFIGANELESPAGACADDKFVAVAEYRASRVSVFTRADGALLRRFGDGDFRHGLLGMCFIGKERSIAVVARGYPHFLKVFNFEGKIIRTSQKDDALWCPTGVASSALGELIVADHGNSRVVVFDASGKLVKEIDAGCVTGVAVHGGAIFAQTYMGSCKVFM